MPLHSQVRTRPIILRHEFRLAQQPAMRPSEMLQRAPSTVAVRKREWKRVNKQFLVSSAFSLQPVSSPPKNAQRTWTQPGDLESAPSALQRTFPPTLHAARCVSLSDSDSAFLTSRTLAPVGNPSNSMGAPQTSKPRATGSRHDSWASDVEQLCRGTRATAQAQRRGHDLLLLQRILLQTRWEGKTGSRGEPRRAEKGRAPDHGSDLRDALPGISLGLAWCQREPCLDPETRSIRGWHRRVHHRTQHDAQQLLTTPRQKLSLLRKK